MTRIVDVKGREPEQCTYGRCTSGCRRNFSRQEIQRYRQRVRDRDRQDDENFASVPALNAASAMMLKTEATIPDITFTRTGVPSCLLNTPKYRKNAPS